MTTCPACGADNRATALFCRGCSRRLPSERRCRSKLAVAALGSAVSPDTALARADREARAEDSARSRNRAINGRSRATLMDARGDRREDESLWFMGNASLVRPAVGAPDDRADGADGSRLGGKGLLQMP